MSHFYTLQNLDRRLGTVMKSEILIEDIVKMINEVIDECYERKKRNSKETIEDVVHINSGEYDCNIFDYGIDSLGYIKLIILLEGFYNFEFPDENITSHTLKSAEDFFSAICENDNK